MNTIMKYNTDTANDKNNPERTYLHQFIAQLSSCKKDLTMSLYQNSPYSKGIDISRAFFSIPAQRYSF